MVDHRASGGSLVELPVITCSHCQRGVVINPGRTRERAYCQKCDHYICDECAAVGECKPFEKVIEEIQAAAVKELIYG